MPKVLNLFKKTSLLKLIDFEERAKDDSISKSELLSEIDETLTELKHARLLFQNAYESDVIESCVYKIKSAEARYNYLLRVAKETNTIRPTFTTE